MAGFKGPVSIEIPFSRCRNSTNNDNTVYREISIFTLREPLQGLPNKNSFHTPGEVAKGLDVKFYTKMMIPEYSHMLATLRHHGRNEMADILRTTLSNVFSWKEMYVLWLKFRFIMSTRVASSLTNPHKICTYSLKVNVHVKRYP